MNGAQVARATERPAGQIAQDPREQNRVTDDLGDPRRVGRRTKALTVGDERRCGILSLQLDPAEHRVGDLEHPERLTMTVVQQEVGVLLAAQFGRCHVQAEVFPGDVTCLIDGDRRNRKFGRVEEVEVRHRDFYSSDTVGTCGRC